MDRRVVPQSIMALLHKPRPYFLRNRQEIKLKGVRYMELVHLFPLYPPTLRLYYIECYSPNTSFIEYSPLG